MRLDTFDDQPDLSYDRQLWSDLTTQSAIDRLTSGAHTLVVEGPSYRQRGRVTVDPRNEVRHAR